MEVRQYLTGTIVIMCLTVAVPAAAEDRLVQYGVDRASGAIVRVFKTSTGGRVEVEKADVKVMKTIGDARVITALRAGSDELFIAMDAGSLTVSSTVDDVTASKGDRERLERARILIAGSSAAKRAAALIGEMGIGNGAPIHPMLLTTRAFLLAAAGDGSGGRELSQWARQAGQPASRGRVVQVSLHDAAAGAQADRTPTQCWEAYTKEAIAAWIEYEDCMKDVSWWEFLDAAACAAIYDMRAIGAFSWWLSCVSLG